MRILSRPLKSTLLAATVAAAALLGACTTTTAGLRPESGPASVSPAAVPISAPAAYATASLQGRRQAGAPRSSFMALGDRALPPVGFMEFCTRYPGECGRDAAQQQPTMRAGAYDRYYWATAFGGGPAAARSRTAAAVSTPAFAFAPQARFDWTLVFGAAQAGQIAQAAAPPAAVAAVTMDDALWAQLADVNRRVNGAIREESDLDATGVSDHWDLPLADGRRVGDCEDFALEKRRALVAMGMPDSALGLALVVTRWGESHAVLVVRTDAGDYVMDSLRPEVTPWRDLDYRWIARQTPGDPSRWVKVG